MNPEKRQDTPAGTFEPALKTGAPALRLKAWRKLKEKWIEHFFLANGLLAVFIIAAIFSLLVLEGFPALKAVGFREFFLRTNWDPTSP